MVTPRMISQIIYILTVGVGFMCFPYVNWKQFGKTWMPFWSVLAILSPILVSIMNVIEAFEECDTQCTEVVIIISAIWDFATSITLDICFVQRLKALMTLEHQKRWLWLFYLIPIAYFGVDFMLIRSFYVPVDKALLKLIFGIGNLATPLNNLGLHLLLAYHLIYGSIKDRIHSLRDKVHRLTYLILANMVLALGSAVLAVFYEVPGTSLVYFFWTVDVLFFQLINRLLVRSYSRPSSMGNSKGNRSSQIVQTIDGKLQPKTLDLKQLSNL